MADYTDAVLKIDRALKNADVLDVQVGGDESATWVAPSGETGLSFLAYIKRLFENGGFPARPFLFYQNMVDSDLANGEYAIVVFDADPSKNGYYLKSSNKFNYLRFNPFAQIRDALNKPQIYFKAQIIVDKNKGVVSYPAGIAIKSGSNSVPFAAANLNIGFGENKNRAYCHYLDYTDMTIKSIDGSNAAPPIGGDYVVVSISHNNIFASPYNWADKTESGSALKQLRKALINPLHSVQIRLIGDSITWGEGATGNSTKEPRAHALSDARNNLTAPTWANLFRTWVGKSYLDESTLVPESPLTTGSGYYQKAFYIDPTTDTNIKLVKDGAVIEKSVTTRSEPYFGRCLDVSPNINSNANVEFELYGDNFTIRYAGQSGGTNRFVDIYDNNVKVGELDYSSPAAWGQEKSFSLPFGKHNISIRNRSTDSGALRLEAIKVNQKVRVINDGLQGTWTGEWLPSGNLLSTVQAADEFIFIQLGTNDKGVTTKPTDPRRTRDNLETIAKHLIAQNKKVVLMSANALLSTAEASMVYNNGDIARVTERLADDLSIDYINNYQATVQAKIDGISYTSDGLHPNDTGHRLIFENIKKAILTA